MANSKILDLCNCRIFSPENFLSIRPCTYISVLQTYLTNFKFHYTHDHQEYLVSLDFFTKFVCSFTEILNVFRRQVLHFNDFVCYPFPNFDSLSDTTASICAILSEANKLHFKSIPKKTFISLLDSLKKVSELWEEYIYKNGITRFV